MDLTEHKELTYWLFKYRVRNSDKARVASDTRKGLAQLQRMAAVERDPDGVRPGDVSDLPASLPR
jgi:hypothetical protein